MTERSHQLESAWLRLKQERGPGWYWLAHQQFGDIFNYCTLASAFKARHSRDLPMYMVVGSGVQAKVAGLFREQFDDIIVVPELNGLAADWREVFIRLGLPEFSPEAPLLCHPHVYPWFNGVVRPYQEPWSYDFELFAATNRLSWMQIFKYVLRLAPDVEPKAPLRLAQATAQATSLLGDAQATQGRSVILFPFAQSLPVVAIGHFETLAAELKSRGWSVFTSVAGQEEAVPGTLPISIPFAILPDVAELAGWAIMVRSGIADIVSGAQCRKTVISSEQHLREWGLDHLELCRDAQQLAFDFAAQSSATFVDAVLTGAPRTGAPIVRGLSYSLYEAGAAVASFSFVDIQREKTSAAEIRDGLARHLRRRPFGAPFRAVRLTDIPARDHPRWGERIDRVVREILAGPARGLRYYACRDNAHDDALQEIDLTQLQAGLYVAASFFHTLIVVRGTAVDRHFPVAGALPLAS